MNFNSNTCIQHKWVKARARKQNKKKKNIKSNRNTNHIKKKGKSFFKNLTLLANHVHETRRQCSSPTPNLSGGKVPNMITTQVTLPSNDKQ